MKDKYLQQLDREDLMEKCDQYSQTVLKLMAENATLVKQNRMMKDQWRHSFSVSVNNRRFGKELTRRILEIKQKLMSKLDREWVVFADNEPSKIVLFDRVTKTQIKVETGYTNHIDTLLHNFLENWRLGLVDVE